MGKALKNLGFGLVYVLLLPLLVAILVASFFVGLFFMFKEIPFVIYRFFRGEKPLPPLPEDELVEKIKKKQMEEALGESEEKEEEKPATPSVQNVYIQQNFYQHPENANQALPNNNVPPFPNPQMGIPNINQALPNQQNVNPPLMDAEAYRQKLIMEGKIPNNLQNPPLPNDIKVIDAEPLKIETMHDTEDKEDSDDEH